MTIKSLEGSIFVLLKKSDLLMINVYLYFKKKGLFVDCKNVDSIDSTKTIIDFAIIG